MTLPDGWKQGRLGELCSIEIGGTPSRGVAAYWDSAHDTSNVWVSIRDMRQRLITGSAEQISDLGVKKSNVKLQQPGTVLLSFKLSIGRVAIAAVPLLTNEAIAGLSPTGLTRDFLFHGLQGWDLLQGVDQAIKGATLNKQKLKKILFEYPESEREQAKIAEVLSTVDRAIEETAALIAKQQRIKTGLTQDLLTRGIDEHGDLRSEQTHEFKDSPLGRIPVEWACDRLGLHLTTIEQGWSPDCDGDPAPVGCWGVLKTTAVVWDRYQDFENKLLPAGLEPRPRLEVQPKDVLMTRGGPNSRVGVVAYVKTTQQNLMLSDKLYRLRYKLSVHPEFLAMALASSWTQRHLSTLKTGLAESQTNISQAIVKDLLIRVPLPGEQEQIASVVRELDRQLMQLRFCLEKLRAVKTGLMQDFLTGDRRVTALLRSSKELVGA